MRLAYCSDTEKVKRSQMCIRDSYKGKTVEKWTALIPAASSGETSRYGVLLVYRKKAVRCV